MVVFTHQNENRIICEDMPFKRRSARLREKRRQFEERWRLFREEVARRKGKKTESKRNCDIYIWPPFSARTAARAAARAEASEEEN